MIYLKGKLWSFFNQVWESLNNQYKNLHIEKNIISFLTANSLTINDVDVVITGRNGDKNNDAIYNGLDKTVFANSEVINYKHLCGEYPTATSFALWLAANVVKTGTVPAIVADTPIAPKKVLIYNHYQRNYHSLMLLSAC